MGLLSDTIDFVGDTVTDTVDAIGDVLSGTSETVDDTTDSISSSLSDAVDSVTQTVDNTEDGINDAVQDTAEFVGESVSPEGLYEIVANGVGTIEGLFRTLGDILAGIKIQGVSVGSLFYFIADVLSVVSGFFAFVGGLNNYEGMVFLLGILLVILALFMFFSSFGLQTFDSVIVGMLGMGFITYASQNMTGAVLVVGMGMILVSLALLADRTTFFVYGLPIYLVGLVMLFTTLKIGFLAMFILTAAAVLGLIYTAETLENRIGPRVGRDEPILVGAD